MDNARFYSLVMGKKKDELQTDLLQLGRQAYLLAQDAAMTDENGDLLPADQQKDEQVREVFRIVGL
jgi:hypothetical protein